MIRTIAGCVLVLAACVGAARAQPAPKPWGGEREVAMRAAERDAATTATITSATVAAPLGYVLLARRGADLCALRFTEFHRAHVVGVGALFSSGDETVYGEYDWYHQGDGSGDLTRVNVKSGHRTLKRAPVVGLGRLAFHRGSTVVVCGPFRLLWTYPTRIGFHGSNHPNDDKGNELAPTKRRDVRDIDARDPRLTWYRLDQRRTEAIRIPVDKLW
jgi:hypothetical protein